MADMDNAGVLSRCLKELRDDLRTLPHLRRLHDRYPDGINQHPAMVVLPVETRWRFGAHAGDRGKPMRVAIHTIAIIIYIKRSDMSRDVENLIDWFSDSLPDYLFAGFHRDQYGGTAVTLGDPRTGANATDVIRVTLEDGAVGTDDVLKLRCELDVTTNLEINV